MMVASLIVITAYFSVYIWMTSIGAGTSLIRLLPSSTLTRHALRLFRPQWEITNVFLLFGIAGLMILFHHGLRAVSGAVLPSLLVGLAALVLRICLVFYMYYTKAKTGLTWRNLLLVLASFGVPMSFGAVGVHMLLGDSFWQSAAGWMMMSALGIGLLAVALSFVYFVIGQTPHDRLHVLSRILNILMCVVIAATLQMWSVSGKLHFVTQPYIDLMVLLGLLVLLQLVMWRSARERYMWWYTSALALIVPSLLVLANRPYLLYPTVLVNSAYGGADYGTFTTIVLAILLPVLLLGSGVLGWSLLSPKSYHHKAH